MQYHKGHNDKPNRKLSIQEIERRFTSVDPVDFLRAALARSRNTSEWARAHGMSPSYVRQVLRGERGAGPKLLDALNIDRFVVFSISNDNVSIGVRKRPEPAGYAVMYEKFVLWAGVNEGHVWNEIFSWEHEGEFFRSLCSEMTCHRCSQALIDLVEIEGYLAPYAEVDGVLCREDEASTT